MSGQGRIAPPRFQRSIIGTSLVLFSFCVCSGAHADWAESLGIGQKSSNLGGAVTATSNDYDAFYTNPAGAANFTTPFVGFGLKVMDARTLDVRQSDISTVSPQPTDPGCVLAGLCGTAPRDGLNLSPERTLPGADVALVPSFGAYAPIPGYKGIVVGIGMGTPFLVSADYGHTGVPGNYGQFNTDSAGLVVVETSPTIALKVNDRLNVGASVGVTTFKYLQQSSAIGAPQATLPLIGQQSFGVLSIGSMKLQTDSSVRIPGIEPEFDAGGGVSVTLGAQYKFTDKLTAGVAYRSKTPETFTGTASASINEIRGGLLGSIASFAASDRFSYEVELPAELKVGAAYDMTPRWKVMADVVWTNWSDTRGFGRPGVITMANGTIDPGGNIVSQSGSSPAAAILVDFGGVKSAPIQTITTDYNAHDTVSLHLGSSYKLTPNLELQAGYVYDPSFIGGNTIDLITLSSNRHIFSFGGTYTLPASKDGEWAITAGVQLVDYEHRHIALNQSQMLGGINGLQAVLDSKSGLHYSSNSLGGLDIGGYVWAAGVSISYKWN